MSINEKKAEVFEISKDIAINEGLSKLTIRNLANKANISIGSVYNLFGTKDKLILELIEYYWTSSLENIFDETMVTSGNFIDRLNALYIGFKTTSEEFHKDWIKDVFNVHMANPDIVNMSNKYKSLIELKIKDLIDQDKSLLVQFDSEFTPEDFSEFIFENMMMLLRNNSNDLGFLKIVLRKILI